jgi:hypothetical protein
MTRFKIKKLDKRNTGHSFFKYMLEFRTLSSNNMSEQLEYYNSIRDWFCETYGNSCELEYNLIIRGRDRKHNKQWCWYTYDHRIYRIYILDDAVLNWFTIRWN